MSTLDAPAVAGLLAQLFTQADRDDPAAFQRAKRSSARRTNGSTKPNDSPA